MDISNLEKDKSQNEDSKQIVKKEFIIEPLKSFETLEQNNSEEFSKKICSLSISTKLNNIITKGFFFKFSLDNEAFNCLITNENAINDENIKNNNVIDITYEISKKTKIKLDSNKRFIKSFKDELLDIIVIEILNEDNIPEDYFLHLENENKINTVIYLLVIKIKKYI